MNPFCIINPKRPIEELNWAGGPTEISLPHRPTKLGNIINPERLIEELNWAGNQTEISYTPTRSPAKLGWSKIRRGILIMIQ